MRSLLVACALCLLGMASAHAANAAGSVAPAEAEQQLLVLLNLPSPHFRPDGNYSAGYADAAGHAARRRIAASLARSNGLNLVTGWPLPILGLDCYVLEVPQPRRADDVATLLARDPRVAWTQPMNVFRALGLDDPLYSQQPAGREWHLS